MEDAGSPVSNGLGIAIHLVDMLPTILANLAFHTIAPMLTSFPPEVYASNPWLKTNILNLMHTPPPHSDHMAMDVLHDEIVCNLGGAPRPVTEHFPIAMAAIPSIDYLGGQEGEVGAEDGTTKSPCASHSPCSLGRHSQTPSPSPQCHTQKAESSSSSSSSSSISGSASGSSASGSSWSGSGSHAGSRASSWACSDTSGSHVSIHSHSASLEIVLVHDDDDDAATHGEEDEPHSDDKANLSQGTLSLPDISASDARTLTRL